jgi:hypothetical protein
MTEDDKQPEAGLSTIIGRIVANEDNERLRSFTSLINTFNYAVQVQGGRDQWQPKDFRLFCIALVAMDQINDKVSPPDRDKSLLRAVEDSVNNGRHAKNA